MRRCAGSRRDDLTRADCPVVVGVMTAADVSHTHYGAGGRGFPGPSKGQGNRILNDSFLADPFVVPEPRRGIRNPGVGYGSLGEQLQAAWHAPLLWVPRIQYGAGSAPACAGVTFLRRDDGGPPVSSTGAGGGARNDERGITSRCDCPRRKGDSGAGLWVVG